MNASETSTREPWNKGKLVGQKTPFRIKDIWAIRVRLQLAEKVRDLAIFELAIDSKLRACDLVALCVRDVTHGNHISSRATIMQKKTKRPVQFEITDQTHNALKTWILRAKLRNEDYLFRFFVASCGFGLIEQAAHRTANQVDHGDEVGLVPVAAGA
ncbi:hypothetical protein SAMN04488129_13216 [Halomonas daqiaonensis]|uniref:Phage integrase family protein n=1 Tax=Halomonas daqiaonensis TaxID=650850 RepID=A0A1H7WGN3_9GAMM|nr:hypothetical protein SAMN04488129_13216 [Halomonas daqiaonensis]